MRGQRTGSPLVSILINNYNYGRFLPEAIESALNQTYPNTEVIVVDDGSTDDSREVIARYGDRVVPVFKTNGGQGSAFNAGVAAGSGDVICFLDADDVWAPHKVERVVETLERHPEVGWLRHKLEMVDEELASLGAQEPVFEGSRPISRDPYLYLETRVSVPTSGLVLRRAAAEKVFPIPERSAEVTVEELVYDADAYVIAVLGTKDVGGYSLDEVLGYYRQHSHQRFGGVDDEARRLRRGRETGKLVSAVWSGQMGTRRISTRVYKLSLILDVLDGRPVWSVKRLSVFAKGLAGTLSLLPKNSRLAMRQTFALLSAFVFPHSWLRRLARSRGLEA
ncbi:MAG: glycosyltransferase [Actinomycetota bacterium]